MLIGSEYDWTVGGNQGTGYQGLAYDAKYGVSQAQWITWSKHTQTLWLQEYKRTSEQQNYSTEVKDLWFEEAQMYNDFREGDTSINPLQPILDTTSDVFLGVGLLGLALLLRR